MKGESLYKISKLMENSPEICRRQYAALLLEAMVKSLEFGSLAKTGNTQCGIGPCIDTNHVLESGNNQERQLPL